MVPLRRPTGPCRRYREHGPPRLAKCYFQVAITGRSRDGGDRNRRACPNPVLRLSKPGLNACFRSRGMHGRSSAHGQCRPESLRRSPPSVAPVGRPRRSPPSVAPVGRPKTAPPLPPPDQSPSDRDTRKRLSSLAPPMLPEYPEVMVSLSLGCQARSSETSAASRDKGAPETWKACAPPANRTVDRGSVLPRTCCQPRRDRALRPSTIGVWPRMPSVVSVKVRGRAFRRPRR